MCVLENAERKREKIEKVLRVRMNEKVNAVLSTSYEPLNIQEKLSCFSAYKAIQKSFTHNEAEFEKS